MGCRRLQIGLKPDCMKRLIIGKSARDIRISGSRGMDARNSGSHLCRDAHVASPLAQVCFPDRMIDRVEILHRESSHSSVVGEDFRHRLG